MSPLQQVLAWFAGIVVSFILILNTLQISAPRLSLEDPGYRFFSLVNSLSGSISPSIHSLGP